jgi:hypothetical protein
MKMYYVIEGALYVLSEKKEERVNSLFPIDKVEMHYERLQWIEVHGKFIGTVIIENY